MGADNISKQPRVLVGCPISSYKEYCIEDYLNGLKNLTYENKEVLLLDNSKGKGLGKKIKKFSFASFKKTTHLKNVKEMIIRDRNALRKKVLDEKFDYFLSLEQDVVAPPNIIEKLLSHNKKVCSALYFNPELMAVQKQRNKSFFTLALAPVCYTWADPEIKEVRMPRRMLFEEVFPSRVHQVLASGLGCVLIHRSVLEKVKFRFKKNTTAFDDIYFGIDCLENGFEIWLDSSIVCRHEFREWPEELKRRLNE